MGLECGECEHDLRGGHHPSCSRYRPPARCAICDKQLVDGDGEEYCPTHGSVDAVYNFDTEASMHEKAGGAGDQMTDETAHIACAAAVLDDEYAALNRHLHGDRDKCEAMVNGNSRRID